MAVNFSAARIRCWIDGVDYSAQVIETYNFGYDQLPANAAGGVLPFRGQVRLGCVPTQPGRATLPIDNRDNRALFALTTDLTFELEVAGVWHPLPPMQIETANYNEDTGRTTLVVGDRLYLNSQVEQSVDSRVAEISVGGSVSGMSAIIRLLRQVGISDISLETDSRLNLRYPRSFSRNYISAASDLAQSEGVVVFTAPSGQVIIRETRTLVPDNPGPFPLPILGTFRYGERKSFSDQNFLDRPISEFTAVALPGAIGTRYSTTVSYYQIFETPDQSVSASPDGGQTTTTSHDFGAAMTQRVTRTREAGADVYAGIAGQASGQITSETQEELEDYDRNEPGRLLRQLKTEEARVAKVAKSLAGWYAAEGGDGDTNETGEVTAVPFPGSLWSSTITTKEEERQISYHSDKPTVIDYETTETKMAAIAIFDGLTNGVPWDLIRDNSPVGLGSLQFASSETTQWVETERGSWEIIRSRKTVKALAGTGERSAIIGGLQRAAEDDDTAKARFWLGLALRQTTLPTVRTPASPDNAPPAFTPKPRQYRGESTSTTAEVSYGYAIGEKDVPKSASIPFVSDESGTALGSSFAETNARAILGKIARLDRMNARSYQIKSPPYPELLAGFSPYPGIDVYVAKTGKTYRCITGGLSLTGSNQEAVINCVAPTLAQVVGNTFISPFQEVT